MTVPTVATIRMFGREISVVRGVAATVCAVAALVLFGWAAGIDLLTRGLPNLLPYWSACSRSGAPRW